MFGDEVSHCDRGLGHFSLEFILSSLQALTIDKKTTKCVSKHLSQIIVFTISGSGLDFSLFSFEVGDDVESKTNHCAGLL